MASGGIRSFNKNGKETGMRRLTPTLISFGALVLASTPISAEVPENAITLTPEQMKWEDNPRVPGLGVAKILGDAKEPGPFVHRVSFPKGRIVQAHSHPDDRTYTVISGTWYIGWGEIYDESKLIALPAGSFYTEPAGIPHFVATPDAEAVVQITGTGPTKVDYVDAAHAPKK
jgi:quercetin dioxygenase-like cupin family protein